jgi:hypothetical protein
LTFIGRVVVIIINTRGRGKTFEERGKFSIDEVKSKYCNFLCGGLEYE